MQKLAEVCIRRPVFATMLIMSLMVLGFYSYFKLGVDLYPKVEFPFVVVTTTLNGASPEEIESQITEKVEEAVNTISGIEELSSTSSEGMSQVFIKFVLERPVDQAAQDVRDKINTVLNDLPEGTDTPVIQKLDPDASPVLALSISADRSSREITYTADKLIKQQLETIDGVGSVQLVGDRTREVQIFLDAQKMEQYQLSVDQVKTLLAAQNVEVPGGRIDQDTRELQLRTLGRVEKVSDFEEIILTYRNGMPIRVKNIARVEDGVEEVRSLARLNGKETVVLIIRKQSGTNTLDVVDRIKSRLADIQKTLPKDYAISVNQDQTNYIKGSFEAIQEHLIVGAILAALVVMLFIRNFRSMIISAIAIPTSIIATFTLMLMMGYTLNMMTMMALVLCVGIVIDDAIVILENIFRFIEEKNMSPMEAARVGTADIGMAVMATTLSLIIIFLPLAFMSGIVGRFMSSFGMTCAFAIAVSLLVSFTLTPMLCSRFIKHDPKGDRAKDSLFYRSIDGFYTALLKWSLRYKWIVIGTALLLILSPLVLIKLVGTDFMVNDDEGQFQVTIRAPEGYSLSATKAITDQVEKDIQSLPGIKNTLVLLGSDSQAKVNRGSIYIELVDRKKRKETQNDIMGMTRNKLAQYKNVNLSVQMIDDMAGGAGMNADIMYYVQGPDFKKLEAYANRIMYHLSTTKGVVDIDSSLEEGKPEVRVRIDRDRAADLGVNVSSIALSLRTLVGGEIVSNYKELDDRYEVRLRTDVGNRNQAEAIKRLYVPSTKLGMVRLDQVAKLDYGTGPSEIKRYARQRQVMIYANIDPNEKSTSLGAVIDNINAFVDNELKMESGYNKGLLGRAKELGNTFQNFAIAFILSFIFMYMILAAQFESFTHPITILLSLPLSIPFALLSLLFFRETLNIFSLLGLFMLFGVVKKNAILQVDHANNLRRHEGLAINEAIVQACRDRLRPILMTTFCLIAGMTPMALGTGAGSAMRKSVAIVVIGGQALCLLITLLVTPVAYTLLDQMGNYFKKLFGFKDTVEKPLSE